MAEISREKSSSSFILSVLGDLFSFSPLARFVWLTSASSVGILTQAVLDNSSVCGHESDGAEVMIWNHFLTDGHDAISLAFSSLLEA
jgi:hypothetical protein